MTQRPGPGSRSTRSTPPPPSPRRPTVPPGDRQRRRRIVLAAAGAVALLLVAVNAVLLYLTTRPPPEVAAVPDTSLSVVIRPPEQPAAPAPPEPALPQPAAARPAPVAGFAEIAGSTAQDLRLFRFAGNPNVLVLDFPTLHAQALALNRIAALVEKDGAPRDRVLSDSEFQGFLRTTGADYDTFYFGHDYRATDLVRFFTLARLDRIGLNASEEEIARILADQGFMLPENGTYRLVEPEKALISLVQVQPDNPATAVNEAIDARLRDTILRHELSHGEFFTNAAYRDYATLFWHQRMTEGDRMAFRNFLAGEGYDPSNEYMMVNEMQAYLLHTPDERAFNPAALGMTLRAVEQLRRQFLAAAPPSPVLGPALPAAPTAVRAE